MSCQRVYRLTSILYVVVVATRRKACLASRKEKESVEAFERATEADSKVYDVKTHVCAKFERHRRHDIRPSSGLDDPWSCGGCDFWRFVVLHASACARVTVVM
jgi:hypothetical protein